jgi:prepilin-type N-terminal cleavage/methylation domain-containing protein
MKSHTPLKKSALGFTLVEVLVAMTVFGLAMGSILLVVRQVMNAYMYEQGRVAINQDIRKLTQNLTQDAIYSNYYRIYANYQNRSDNGSYNGTADTPKTDGQSGDFLVFITETVDTTDSIGKQKISQMVAYYRDAPAPTTVNGVLVSSAGPVRRRVVNFSPAIDPTLPANSMLNLLNNNFPVASQSSQPIVVQLAQGLSNGNLFYNFYNRSVIIRGQIQESGNLFQKTASTYNFTVSPRG